MFKLIGTCLRGSCKAIAAHSLVLLLRIVLEHLIRLSYVAKHEFKKSNLRHSRNRWLKDVNRKKNLKGRTIERVRLFHEYLLVAKKALTDCFNRFKTVRRFFFLSHALSMTFLIASPESHFSIQNLVRKWTAAIDLLLLAHKLANHIHSFG